MFWERVAERASQKAGHPTLPVRPSRSVKQQWLRLRGEELAAMHKSIKVRGGCCRKHRHSLAEDNYSTCWYTSTANKYLVRVRVLLFEMFLCDFSNFAAGLSSENRAVTAVLIRPVCRRKIRVA